MAISAPCASAQLRREEHVRIHEQVTVGMGGYNPSPYFRGPPVVYAGSYGASYGGYGRGYGGGQLIGLRFSIFGSGVNFSLGNGWSRSFQVPQGYWRERHVQQRGFDCGIHLSSRRLEDAVLLEHGGHPEHNPNLAQHVADQVAQCQPGYRNIVIIRMP
jgi:hypothetical protein